jgi:universal stress protein A
MLPLKRILVPTDFSEPSYEGVKAAAELARHFEAEMILINVVIPPFITTPSVLIAPSDYMVSQYMQELEATARKNMDHIVAEKVSKDVRSTVRLAFGTAAEEIVREADEQKVDAIVISTHGWTGWRHLIFGSVAEKVVRLAPCPVITIPAPEGKAK